MAYKPLKIDREKLTIHGVTFPDIKTLESAASAIGSQMFEGYEPTVNGITLIRDYMLGKLTLEDLANAAKKGKYV